MQLATGMSSFIHYGGRWLMWRLALLHGKRLTREFLLALEFLSPANMQLINVTNKDSQPPSRAAIIPTTPFSLLTEMHWSPLPSHPN